MTQLFLRQLKENRIAADAQLYAACEVSGLPGRDEARVAARAVVGQLDYCINTIEYAANPEAARA